MKLALSWFTKRLSDIPIIKSPDMFRNYIKIAWRNLLRNRKSSFINVTGLAVGMAVAILIGLWIWSEVSFNKDNRNYDRVASVMQNLNQNGEIQTWDGLPWPLAGALRDHYKDEFKAVTLVNWVNSIIQYHNKPLAQNGLFLEPDGPAMLDLKMIKGERNAFHDPNTIFLSQSAAQAIFGNEEPMNKILVVENVPVKVSGVYKDMPDNSSFSDRAFIAPFELKLKIVDAIKHMENPWGNNSWQIFVQLAEHADFKTASAKIKDEKLKNIREGERIAKPQLFLQPMSHWHLESEFKNGVNTGGRIRFVWWFAVIGIFVLLLACINFMNLSTARSEKRAKEVGIRKAVGSLKKQLVTQFLSESVMTACLAFIFSIIIVRLSLPLFNSIAGKKMILPWNNMYFWLAGFAFTLITGLIAGSYPAFYLAHFNPVSVLKGSFKGGRYSALPRKILVVVQFSVSVILIIGTIVIYRQIQFARNRPLGYDSNGLVYISTHMYDLHSHIESIRADLKESGAVTEISESGSPITEVWNSNGGMSWKGQLPGASNDFPMNLVSYEYGKVVGWQIVEGRDFSRSFASDSAAFILNESAVKFMGLKNPVGEKVSFNDGVAFTVIGVIKDILTESPYSAVRPSMYRIIRGNDGGMLMMKLNPELNAHEALGRVEKVFRKFISDQPFEYHFTDEDFARKFREEERVGSLATVFAVLAIFISCLGLFGLASFVAEQRIKEIGIRKVLGASVFSLWRLLCRDFVVLVFISLGIAIPLAYWFMHNWLLNYQYKTGLPWWLFVATGTGALMITLLTISLQSLKAALENPVNCLRSE
jgi:putative ABC transport system permease protein